MLITTLKRIDIILRPQYALRDFVPITCAHIAGAVRKRATPAHLNSNKTLFWNQRAIVALCKVCAVVTKIQKAKSHHKKDPLHKSFLLVSD